MNESPYCIGRTCRCGTCKHAMHKRTYIPMYAPTCSISAHHCCTVFSTSSMSSLFPAAPIIWAEVVKFLVSMHSSVESSTTSEILAWALARTDTKLESFVRNSVFICWPFASSDKIPQSFCLFRAGMKMEERRVWNASRIPPPFDSSTPKFTSWNQRDYKSHCKLIRSCHRAGHTWRVSPQGTNQTSK